MLSTPGTQSIRTLMCKRATSSELSALSRNDLSDRQRDRPVREITFDDGVPIGSFRAHDFFGDGSFYLLDAPGHITGHMAGLARTSHGHGDEPDTFILMGADTVHHGSELRPSDELPIPKDKQRKTHGGGVCCFHQLNVDRGRRASGTFFDAVLMEDPEATAQTIRHSQVADALENVFVIAAHDMAVEGVVDLFPATANDWKARGWKEASLWGFLSDLEVGFSKA